MASLDRGIDHLYQVPLSEFTKARGELAKSSGANAADIRRLQKPNLPAWAVNQLYWRERAAYDALVTAAERRRAAQLASLSGKLSDIARADAEHAAAKRDALARIRKILQTAGETASAATLQALNETLDALPSGDAGRLVRPLKPMGFEALAGLLKGGSLAREPAKVVPFPGRVSKESSAKGAQGERTAADTRRAAQEQKREEHARREALKRLRADLRAAESAESKLQAGVQRTRLELKKAARARDEAMKRVDAATAQFDELTDKMRRAERDLSAAASRRADVESRLEAAESGR
jgi:hypothetical protein